MKKPFLVTDVKVNTNFTSESNLLNIVYCTIGGHIIIIMTAIVTGCQIRTLRELKTKT